MKKSFAKRKYISQNVNKLYKIKIYFSNKNKFHEMETKFTK